MGDRLGLDVGLAVGLSAGDRLRLAVGLADGLAVTGLPLGLSEELMLLALRYLGLQ